MHLNLDIIQPYLSTNAPRITIFPAIESDMAYLRQEIAANPHAFPHATLTEHLLRAKTAKQGINWYSPPRVNVSLSLGFTFRTPATLLSGLSLVVGLAVVRVLTQCDIPSGSQLKWPNDVYWQGKKICGILVETIMHNADTVHAIIGIGLNVNMVDTPTIAIDQSWTSLQLITGVEQDRNKIAALLIEQLMLDLPLFQQQRLTPFLPLWPQYDYLAGKHITLQNAQGSYMGIARGIDEHGRLLLQDAQGTLQPHTSGSILR